MKKRKLLVPILTGLVVGQIFAEGERPVTIVNTLRFGYSDNIDRTPDKESSGFVQDDLDVSFNVSLSDRTEWIFKSRFIFKSDGDNTVYPNIYTVLDHSVSPRLLLRVTEYFRSGDKTTGTSNGKKDYYRNDLGLLTTYVVNERNRLEADIDYNIRRHNSAIDDEDSTSASAGIFWARDVIPMRNRIKVGLRQTGVDYDNADSSFDMTSATAEMSHTFNQEWQGTVVGGISRVKHDFEGGDNETRPEPLFKLRLVYSPSPRTRIMGTVGQSYQISDLSRYNGQSEREYRLALQHDVTSKILAKAFIRFLDVDYDARDNKTSTGDSSEERLDLEFRLAYKINRLNFIGLEFKHREKEYDDGIGDWEENRIDLGWRVEL